MSRLIFKGDLDLNFGQYYPTPYIDKIYVVANETHAWDSNITEGIRFDLSIFLPEWDKASPAEQKQEINNLYVFAGFVIGDDVSKLVNSETSIADMFREFPTPTSADSATTFADSRASVPTGFWFDNCPDGMCDSAYAIRTKGQAEYDMWSGAQSIAYNAYCYTNIISLRVSDFVGSDSENPDHGDESYYDEDNEIQYYRYNVSVTIPMAGDYYTWEELLSAAYVSDDGTDDQRQVAAFTFSSVSDLMDLKTTTSTDYGRVYSDPWAHFKSRALGEVAYEEVFRNGSLLTDPQPIYVDTTGTYYNGVPMYSLGGTLHKHDQQSSFAGALLSIFGATTDSEITDEMSDFAASVISMTSEYKHSPKLLLQANKLKAAFPDKNLAGSVGAQYQRFKSLIAQENAATKMNQVVTIKLIRNNKLVDLRGAVPVGDFVREEPQEEQCDDDDDWTHTRLPGDDAGTASASNLWRITRYRYSQDVNEDPSEYLVWDRGETLCNYGVLFFDYEKALRNDTYVSRLFDIDKLEHWFGKEFTQGALRFKQTTLDRHLGDSTDNKHMSIVTNYTYEAFEHTPISNMFHYHDSLLGECYPQIEIGMNGTTDYSYCILRNFVDNYRDYELESFTTSGYRLAAFQFQDYLSSYYGAGVDPDSDVSSVADENYRFYVTLYDYTYILLEYLAANLKTEMANFLAYYEIASENCNYDSEESTFNSAFVEGISAQYEDTPGSAPYASAPILYELHRDILFNTHGGGQEALLEKAAHHTSNLHPETATLAHIAAFYELMEELYTLYYDQSEGELYDILGDDPETPRKLDYCRLYALTDGAGDDYIIEGAESREEYEEELEMYGAYETDAWTSSPTYTRTILETDAIERMQELATYLNDIWIRYYDPYAGGGYNVSPGCCLWKSGTDGSGFTNRISSTTGECGGAIIGDGLLSWDGSASGHVGVYNYVNDMIDYLESMREWNYENPDPSSRCLNVIGETLDSCLMIEAERNAEEHFYRFTEPPCANDSGCTCWRMVDKTTGLDVTIEEWGDAVKEFVMLAYPNSVNTSANASAGRDYDGQIVITQVVQDVGVDTGSSACGWDCSPGGGAPWSDLY